MDSLKETDNLATKPSKRPRIEVDEELMRQMIAGQASLDSKGISRMDKADQPGMKALPFQAQIRLSGPINRVPRHRMA